MYPRSYSGGQPVMVVTPFGLLPAPRLSAEIWLVLVAWLRCYGVLLFACLDNILVTGSTPDEVLWTLLWTIHILPRM